MKNRSDKSSVKTEHTTVWLQLLILNCEETHQFTAQNETEIKGIHRSLVDVYPCQIINSSNHYIT